MTRLNVSTKILTIFIPTFQRHDYAVKNITHLESLLQQDIDLRDNIEILLSDNNSDYNAFKQIEDAVHQLKSESISIHRHLVNYGVGGNIVEAYDKITSPYIMFCGDDDFLDPAYLLHIIKVIHSKLENEIVISHCSIQGVRPNGLLGLGRNLNEPNRVIYKPCNLYGHMLSHQLSGLVLCAKTIQDLLFKLRSENKHDIDHIYVCMTLYSLLNTPNITYYQFNQTPVYVHNSALKSWFHSVDDSIHEISKAFYYAIDYSNLNLSKGLVYLSLFFTLLELYKTHRLTAVKASFKYFNSTSYKVVNSRIFQLLSFLAIISSAFSILGSKTTSLLHLLFNRRALTQTKTSPFHIDHKSHD